MRPKAVAPILTIGLRFDLAGAADRGGEVLADDFAGDDLGIAGLGAHDRQANQPAGHHQHRNCNQNLLFHASLPVPACWNALRFRYFLNRDHKRPTSRNQNRTAQVDSPDPLDTKLGCPEFRDREKIIPGQEPELPDRSRHRNWHWASLSSDSRKSYCGSLK